MGYHELLGFPGKKLIRKCVTAHPIPMGRGQRLLEVGLVPPHVFFPVWKVSSGRVVEHWAWWGSGRSCADWYSFWIEMPFHILSKDSWGLEHEFLRDSNKTWQTIKLQVFATWFNSTVIYWKRGLTFSLWPRLKDFGQYLHLNGVSPVCVNWCRFNVPWRNAKYFYKHYA